MRYKDLVMTNLEQLDNAYTNLEYLIRTNNQQAVLDWFEKAKEKIDHIKTLVNREGQD